MLMNPINTLGEYIYHFNMFFNSLKRPQLSSSKDCLQYFLEAGYYFFFIVFFLNIGQNLVENQSVSKKYVLYKIF